MLLGSDIIAAAHHKPIKSLGTKKKLEVFPRIKDREN